MNRGTKVRASKVSGTGPLGGLIGVALLLGGCGADATDQPVVADGGGPTATSSDDEAVALCDSEGRATAAEWSSPNDLTEVHVTTAAAVARWHGSRGQSSSSESDVPEDARYAAMQPEARVIICYFEADDIQAPSGPPSWTTDPRTGEGVMVPPQAYDTVTTYIDADGEGRWGEAIRSTIPGADDRNRRVAQDRAPQDARRVR